MWVRFLSKGKKKELLRVLKKSFGIEKPPFLFFETSKETRIFTGSVSKDDLGMLVKNLRIQSMGLYFAKKEDGEFRLSLDATHLLSKEIKKNILEISDEQKDKWMNGENLEIDESLKGIFIVKNKEDFLSSGKASNGKLFNFIPKERRTGNY
jgi:NOL1/NOP2/fmu family ribosome biogenesis protein